MSSNKSYRRVPPQKSEQTVDRDSTIDPKYRSAVNNLQELFPNWSQQDLQSALVEVNGDVETAVTRISEGHAEQWGNVSRKKDKKPAATPLANATNNSFQSSNSPPPRGGRGNSRGGRGASTRSGRGGGPGRSSTPRSAANASSRSADTHVNGSAAAATEGWGTEAPVATTDNAPASDSWGTSTGGDWGSGSVPANDWSSTSANDWTSETTSAPEVKPAAAEPVRKSAAKVNGTSASAAPVPVKSTSVVGSKLSWAQIARPQEKPKPTPPPAPPPVEEEAPVLEPPAEQEPEPEEPTTVQAPTWDEEPAHAHISTSISSFPTEDTLASSSTSLTIDEDGWVITSKEEMSPIIPVSTAEVDKTPAAELSPAVSSSTPALTAGSSSSTASPTPPPPTAQGQKRLAGRFKSDQAVVMPSFGQTVGFGNSLGFGSGVGAMGMQFGSLNIGGDDDGPPPAPEPAAVEKEVESAPVAPTVVETSPIVPDQHSPQQLQQQVQTQTQSPVPSFLSQTTPPQPEPTTAPPAQQTAPTPLASLAGASFFQPQATQSQHVAATAAAAAAPTPSFSSFNPLGQQAAQPTPPQHPSPIPQGYSAAAATQHSALSSHTHADQPTSYYRQQDYGAGFSPLSSMAAQQQQQAQDSSAQGASGGYAPFSNLAASAGQNPIGNFANNPQQPDFGNYADQRGFYEGSYAQQSGFTGGRNFLGHDELGKLAAHQHHQQPQSTQPANSISPASAPSAQMQPNQQPLSSHSQTPPTSTPAQAGAGGQQQQGQQGYPPPVPYYHYNPYYSQPNPYYTGPNPGYGVGVNLGQVQPFMNMKYPVYPQGGVPPAGPGTPSVQGKAATQSVPPPGPNSYGAHSALYGGGHHQHQGGYDDGNYGAPQHHQLQHQHQPQHQTEYGKPPLYGLSQSHSQTLLQAQASRSQQTPAASSSSPENAYKPYAAAKQPGSGAEVNLRGSVQPSYSAPSAGGGGGAGRFGANVNAGVAPVQGQGNYGPQGGVADAGNYYQQYQRPQYWQ